MSTLKKIVFLQSICASSHLHLRRTFFSLLANFFLFVGNLFFACNSSAKTIVISSGEFPPWTGEALPQGGFVNRLVSAAFAQEGIDVKFVYLPWKRAFEEAKKNSVDATSYWYGNAYRKNLMLLSEPLIRNRFVFFQRSSDKLIKWKTLDDLAAYRLTATLGFTYTDEFYSFINSGKNNTTIVPSDVQNIKMLFSGRSDLFATDIISGFYLAKLTGIDPAQLRALTPILSENFGYLMASKHNPASAALIDRFNQGLKKIILNGEYAKIIADLSNSPFYQPSILIP